MLSIIIPLLICFKLYIKIEEGWGGSCSNAGDVWAHQGWKAFFFLLFLFIYFSTSFLQPPCSVIWLLSPHPCSSREGPRGPPNHPSTGQPPLQLGTWTLAQLEFLASTGLSLWSCIFSLWVSVFPSAFPLISLGKDSVLQGKELKTCFLLAPCCVILGMSLCLSGYQKDWTH